MSLIIALLSYSGLSNLALPFVMATNINTARKGRGIGEAPRKWRVPVLSYGCGPSLPAPRTRSSAAAALPARESILRLGGGTVPEEMSPISVLHHLLGLECDMQYKRPSACLEGCFI